MSPGPKVHDLNKVIIFDWDDTICPSSFVDQWKVENFRDLPLHFQNLFREIGYCAEKCLEAAAKCGEVILITNSDDGWVKFSAERFVPNLLPCLDRYRIVSARTRYERFYPSQPLCWKAAAFAHEVNETYASNDSASGSKAVSKGRLNSEDSNDSMVSTDVSSGSLSSMDSLDDSPAGHKKRNFSAGSKLGRREVISFGDSMEERTAVKIVASQLEASPKSVMFVSSPTPMQIIGQLTMLTNHMNFLCHHHESLDLEISPHQAQKAAESFFQNHGTKTERRNFPHKGFVNGGTHTTDVSRIRRTGSGSSDPVAAASLRVHVRMD